MNTEEVVLICGGGGYIGSFVTKEFASRYEKVIVVDDFSNGHRKSIENLKITLVEGNMTDPEFLADVFNKFHPTLAIHLCAFISVEESMQKPLEYYRNNVDGFLTLCECMRDYGCKKVIFSSSCTVFGTPQKLPVDEKNEYNALNPYAETKQICEYLMHWLDEVYQIRGVTFRYFNVAGGAFDGSLGEDHRNESHLIPLVLQVPLGKREKIYIFGDDYETRDGTCIRDYIHVLDIVKAHLCAVDYLNKYGKSNDFNLGTGTGFSVKEVIEVCRKVTGHPIPAEVKGRREGDLVEIYSASQKANEELGWHPDYPSLEDIIKSAWAFHSTHPQGYED